MTTHDPIRHLRHLRQVLSQDKTPIGFFLAAGCPLSVELPKDQWPLIPDVKNLTVFVNTLLSSKTGEQENRYTKLLNELKKAGQNHENIEDILSFVRGLKEVSRGGRVRDFSEEELIGIEKNICQIISNKVDVSLPNKNSPYHKLSAWITSIDRIKPIEVFTVNYDLLMEQSLEDSSIPYFDGFVGSKNPFFDLRAIEEDKIPQHWTRLWKIHGSINWHPKEDTKLITRLTNVNKDGTNLIYPSHLKYSESRKMPYLALMDQLGRFIRQNSSLLILCGYSFNDDHLNNAIINALRSNPTALVIGLQYNRLSNYPEAIKRAGDDKRPNLSIWAFDEAIIGTVRGRWQVTNQSDEKYKMENLADVIEVVKPLVDDDRFSEIDKSTTPFERTILKMGNFGIFANYLQEIIGRGTEEEKIES